MDYRLHSPEDMGEEWAWMPAECSMAQCGRPVALPVQSVLGRTLGLSVVRSEASGVVAPHVRAGLLFSCALLPTPFFGPLG